MTVIPAYGRDYKTAKEAKQAWLDGKDWIVADMFSGEDGRAINIDDAPSGIMLRFCRLTKITAAPSRKAGAK